MIEEHIERVEEILSRWTNELGSDERAYKNHVYRVVNFCFALHAGSAEEREKVVVAACFHDLGIWANGTFDYLAPSIALAKSYLADCHREEWSSEIERMIDQHHKVRDVHDDAHPLIEAFRRSDLVDVSYGVVKFGLSRALVRDVQARFPDAGFHWRLVQLSARWWLQHPFRPVPVLKW